MLSVIMLIVVTIVLGVVMLSGIMLIAVTIVLGVVMLNVNVLNVTF
jgi:hypothetical protein